MPDAKRQALDRAVDESQPTELADPKPATNGSQDEAINSATEIQHDSSASAIPPTTEPLTNDDAVPQEAMPIPSAAAPSGHAALQPSAELPTQDENQWIHIRSVISSSEAATVIGKGGENVTQIRRMSGAKCTVSDYSRGAVERILTVSGAQDAVAKVCRFALFMKP